MIVIPEHTLTPQEQEALLWLVAAMAEATALPHRPNPTRNAVIALGLAAEKVLWEQNLPLVMQIAHRIAARQESDLEELFQEGALLLRDIIRKYNPHLRRKFSTYAVTVLKRQLLYAALPTAYFADTRHFHRVRSRIQQGNDFNATTEGMAAAVRVDPEVLNEIAGEDPYEAVIEANVDLLAPLRGRVREVIEYRFGFRGEAWGQGDLAKHLRVSRSSISRWEQMGLELLKAHVGMQYEVSLRATSRRVA